MSLEQLAFITREAVPTLDALQASVDQLGFDCKIGNAYVPLNSSGFLPCILKGQASGFEIGFGSAAEALRDMPDLPEVVGRRETAISFRWGGSMAECACVMAVCSALARDFDAVVYYPDDELLYSVSDLRAETLQALNLA